jgi:hypothetical protein
MLYSHLIFKVTFHVLQLSWNSDSKKGQDLWPLDWEYGQASEILTSAKISTLQTLLSVAN